MREHFEGSRGLEDLKLKEIMDLPLEVVDSKLAQVQQMSADELYIARRWKDVMPQHEIENAVLDFTLISYARAGLDELRGLPLPQMTVGDIRNNRRWLYSARDGIRQNIFESPTPEKVLLLDTIFMSSDKLTCDLIFKAAISTIRDGRKGYDAHELAVRAAYRKLSVGRVTYLPAISAIRIEEKPPVRKNIV